MAELLIDLYKTKDPYSGLGQFSLNFARAIIEHPRAGQRVTFLRPREFSLPISEDYRQVQANALMRYLPIVHRKYDLWHSLHQFPAHQSPKGSRTILTVHDLNFLVDKSPSKAERYLAELQLNLDRAFAVTAISNYTRTQLRSIPTSVANRSMSFTTVFDRIFTRMPNDRHSWMIGRSFSRSGFSSKRRTCTH
ncbi:MAG: hypothetical protein IPP33_05105 [Flavobacteriales bacterium]|nr:hypothetical protein [Flavobacteriales bacterium]